MSDQECSARMFSCKTHARQECRHKSYSKERCARSSERSKIVESKDIQRTQALHQDLQVRAGYVAFPNDDPSGS